MNFIAKSINGSLSSRALRSRAVVRGIKENVCLNLYDIAK